MLAGIFKFFLFSSFYGIKRTGRAGSQRQTGPAEAVHQLNVQERQTGPAKAVHQYYSILFCQTITRYESDWIQQNVSANVGQSLILLVFILRVTVYEASY
jgi:hypothetical protein